jgi:hypothetical protein
VNGTNLNGGLTLGASFTDVPGGTANWTFSGTNYNLASGAAAIVINKAVPVLTWPQPSAVTAGTALTGAQLNATANIAGTFVYDPPLGTALTASQQLSVTFTPADEVNYTSATAAVTIQVTLTGPQITNPGPQTDTVGDRVRLRISVTRVSPPSGSARDRGVFGATGLAPGLAIESDGEIRGRVTTAGLYHVIVTFTQNGVTVSAPFDWTIASR